MATYSSILAWKIPMDRGAWRATVCEVIRELDTTERLTLSTLFLTTGPPGKSPYIFNASANPLSLVSFCGQCCMFINLHFGTPPSPSSSVYVAGRCVGTLGLLSSSDSVSRCCVCVWRQHPFAGSQAVIQFWVVGWRGQHLVLGGVSTHGLMSGRERCLWVFAAEKLELGLWPGESGAIWVSGGAWC